MVGKKRTIKESKKKKVKIGKLAMKFIYLKPKWSRVSGKNVGKIVSVGSIESEQLENSDKSG